MSEGLEAADLAIKMVFFDDILRVQLARDIGRTLPTEKGFVEVAQELVKEGEKEAERTEEENTPPWELLRAKRGRRPDRNRREGTRRAPRRERNWGPREERPSGNRRACFECGKVGHIAARCSQIKCFECGAQGHVARRCPHMKKRSLWKDEPMEINAQRVTGRQPRKVTHSESEETEEGGSGSEEEVDLSYAKRVRGRATRRQASSTSRT